MLKKTIKYEDFNGNEREEDFYFNLTNAELTELHMSTNGGMDVMIKRIVAAQDSKELIKVFKEIILKAYGVKSLDGRTFVKNDTIREEFASTNAYSVLFMELGTDDKAAALFINGIIPKDKQLKDPIAAIKDELK